MAKSKNGKSGFGETAASYWSSKLEELNKAYEESGAGEMVGSYWQYKLKDLCEDFLSTNDATKFVVTDTLRQRLGIPQDEEIYIGEDSSLTSSGEYGFAVTKDGVYCFVEGMPKVKCTSFERIAHADHFHSPRHTQEIYADDELIAAGSPDLVDLFILIAREASLLFL